MISSSLLNNLRLKIAYAQIDPRLMRPLDRSNHPFFERGLHIDYKLIPREISSSAVQANSSHAWVHKCMGAQKKGRESAYFAFEFISYGVSSFSFVGGY